MLSFLAKFGVAGAVGFLVGIAAVSWIGPTTDGGTALILLVCTILGIAVSALLPRRRTRGGDDDPSG